MTLSSKLPLVEVPRTTLHDYVLQSVRTHGDRPALINNDTGECVTFSGLKEKVEYIANALINLGVEKGEVVLIFCETSPHAFYILLGVSLAGAIASTLSPKMNAAELQQQVSDTESRFAFVDPHGLKEVCRVFSRLGHDHRIICTGPRALSNGHPTLEDLKHVVTDRVRFPTLNPYHDVVYLPFSSGLNGKKKGILTSHCVLNEKLACTNNPSQYVQPKCGETTISMMPFHKQMSMETVLIALINGATIVTLPTFSISTFMMCLEKYKVRVVYTSPLTMASMINEADTYTYDSLETIISGSAAVSEELYNELKHTFPSLKRVVATYGMSEVGLITRADLTDNYTTSCGYLSANLQLKIVDLVSGQKLDAGQMGMIYVRGTRAMAPYLNDMKATKEHFVNGWRKTGDIGYYDNNDRVYIVDKTKEMIKVHGFQVIPTELEALFLTHEAVAEAAVVAISDPRSGERPVGFVVLKKGFNTTAQELKHFVNDRVVRYKRLARVCIAQTLPRSPCGNLLRKMLSEAAILSVDQMK